ncbi:MAG: hypothetical protein DWQ01_03705 [Planctomycetota bacterium]|nr:MAG: hypothetical protein DWQ01_03705 [Planctomycetota bacterium]
MLDVFLFQFVPQYGDAGKAPSNIEISRRDLTPPFAAWVELGKGSNFLPVSQTWLPWNGPGEMFAWKRSRSRDGPSHLWRCCRWSGYNHLALDYG